MTIDPNRPAVGPANIDPGPRIGFTHDGKERIGGGENSWTVTHSTSDQVARARAHARWPTGTVEETDLERRVLAHERILQALIAHMAEADPQFIARLSAVFSDPLPAGRRRARLHRHPCLRRPVRPGRPAADRAPQGAGCGARTDAGAGGRQEQRCVHPAARAGRHADRGPLPRRHLGAHQGRSILRPLHEGPTGLRRRGSRGVRRHRRRRRGRRAVERCTAAPGGSGQGPRRRLDWGDADHAIQDRGGRPRAVASEKPVGARREAVG